MGQYHTIYNKTKKEMFSIGGAKLWEQAHSATAAALLLLLSNSNGRGGGDFCTYPKDPDKPTGQEQANQNVVDLVSGRWAGDEIVVQGDYAEESDKGYIPEDDRDMFKNITAFVAAALLIVDDGDRSDVVLLIESEFDYGCRGALEIVQKKKGKCRNNQTVEKYLA